ncbi:MAG: ABC transporter permease subunit [Kofleriaceae bacterium]|nr:ABC transporter permease subunit [Kofleriaceae bacterium]
MTPSTNEQPATATASGAAGSDPSSGKPDEQPAVTHRAAAIYDLGYKRYAGIRLAASARWRVIMRNQLSTAWKGWWRLKFPLGTAIMITLVAGAVMYVSSNKMFNAIASRGMGLKFSDGIVPFSMTFFSRAAFIFSLTVGASVIAGDAQSGGFTFYFARPVRPLDYVLGKFSGLLLATMLIMMAGPLFLAGERLGLAETTSELVDLLPMLGKAAAAGFLGALVYAALPLGFSALANKRRTAVALWAGAYLIAGTIFAGIGLLTNSPLGALDPPTAVTSLTFHLFDVEWKGRSAMVPLPYALASIGGYVTIGLGLAWWRVNQSRSTGVGGVP